MLRWTIADIGGKGSCIANWKCSLSGVAMLLVLAASLFVCGCRVSIGGRQRPLLRHDPVQGEIEVGVERQVNKQDIPGSDRESRTTLTEERLRLSTQGDFYHPNLLNYTASVGLGLIQSKLSSDEESGRTNDSLDEYNFTGQLLRRKMFPVSVSLAKTETLSPRQYLGAVRNESQSSDVSMSMVSDFLPMSFSYSTNEIEQNSLGSEVLQERDFFSRDEEAFRYSVRHAFSKSSRIRFGFDRRSSIQETSSSKRDTEEDIYTLMQDTSFGLRNEHSFTSFFSYADQPKPDKRKNLQWQERMRLRHTDNLLTHYLFRYSDYEREFLTNEEIRGETGFEHSLYESLVTTGSLFNSRFENQDDNVITRRGGRLGFNYRKRNPWGTLTSKYAVNYTQFDQSGGTGTGFVTGEAHVFDETQPIITFNRIGGIESTVEVTNVDRTEIYTEGDDYVFLEPVNGRLRIRVTTLGVILPNVTDGQVLLLDYAFEAEPEREEDTVRQSFSIGEKFFGGSSIYYRFERQDEELTSNNPDLVPDRFTTNLVGGLLRYGRISLRAEYEDRDATFLPSIGKRYEARYQRQVSPVTRAGIWISHSELQTGEPDKRDITILTVGGEMSHQLTAKYALAASFSYRDEDDSRFGTTNGFEVNSALRYTYRQLRFSTGVEFDLLERNESRTEALFFFFRFKRLF